MLFRSEFILNPKERPLGPGAPLGPFGSAQLSTEPALNLALNLRPKMANNLTGYALYPLKL